MSEFFRRAPEIINSAFDVLELMVIRLALLGLAAFGAWELLRSHFQQ